MTDTMVQHQGTFYIDEGYISSDMPTSPKSPAGRKKSHLNQRSLQAKFSQNEVNNLAQLNEKLMQEMSGLHDERHHFLCKIDQLQDELHTMDLKNEALEREIEQLGDRFQLVTVNSSEIQGQLRRQLDVERQKSSQEVSRVLQRAQDAEKTVEVMIVRIDRLCWELEHVTLDEQLVEDDLIQRRYTKEAVEQELQRLTEAVTEAKQEIINATTLLGVLREEGDVIKDHNKKLETALTATQQQCAELEEQEARIVEKISKLNHEMKAMTSSEQSEDTSKLDVADILSVEELSQAGATLEKDCNTLRNSVWKLLEALKAKQLQVSKLESQLFEAGDSKKALEGQLRRLSTTSVEVSKHAKEEVTKMKQKIAELTDALETNEANSLQLQIELDAARRRLRQRAQAIQDYGIPILAASTSLAVVGICFFLSSKRL